MITVIIAGGSGTRLWPLSTPAYPKQLLKINGDSSSLLQRTYDRAKRVSSAVYVIPEASLIDAVKEQLPELDDDAIIIEPGRRGTANCVVAALVHLAGRHDDDEPIIFMHADHYIRDISGFIHSFMIAGHMSRQENKIVLVGVEPDHPATGFGYIKKHKQIDAELFVFSVDSFKEKPEFKLAQEYVRSGDYLWNCGYFVGSHATFKQAMQQHAPELYKNYERLEKAKSLEAYQKAYLDLDSDAIDYALMERVQELLVVPAAFDWMDMGSYSDLHKAAENDEQGNHTYGEAVELEGVENSFIHNDDKDKPLAVVGLDNVVVINTEAGMLVARKDLAQKVGEVSKRLQARKK